MNRQPATDKILYMKCSFCQAIGTRVFTKIRCPCCHQLSADREELFQCRHCGGPLAEIGADEYHRLYYPRMEKYGNESKEVTA